MTKIAAGGWHSLFRKSDGSLWAMGRNGNGQLGDGTSSIAPYYGTNRPEQIVANGVTSIAGGYYHSLLLKSDGSLWATGDNTHGQLGDGTWSNTNRPEQIVVSGITAIAAGQYHSLFLRSDGSLWAMGDNYWGELGNGTYNYTNCSEQVVASNVTAIAAGWATACFSRVTAACGPWATNDGQLGDGTRSRHQPPGADCGQRRHGNLSRRPPQPVPQERWQFVGHGL